MNSTPVGSSLFQPSVTRRAVRFGHAFAVAVLLLVARAAVADFTIVVLNDTQVYSESNPSGFNALTQWIVNNQTALNIVFVSQGGDIVNKPDQVQYKRASTSMAILDDAEIPYGIAVGNHDVDSTASGRAGNFRKYFPTARFERQPEFGAYYKQQDRTRNSMYHKFRADGLDMLVIHLEWQAPDDVLAWADGVLETHPNHRAMVFTHYYLIPGKGRYDNTGIYWDRKGLNTGQSTWKKLIKVNPNVFMVGSGHLSGEGSLVSANDAGNDVHQIVVDYSTREPRDSNGWLRYYTFRPAENKVYAHSVCVATGKFETDADSQFVIEYDMAAKERAGKRGPSIITPPTSLSNQRNTIRATCQAPGVPFGRSVRVPHVRRPKGNTVRRGGTDNARVNILVHAVTRWPRSPGLSELSLLRRICGRVVADANVTVVLKRCCDASEVIGSAIRF